jgi:hypothetical protein
VSGREKLRHTKNLASLGLRAHSGWAALVAVSGDPRAPEVLVRRRIELADPAIGGSTQPYHAAEGLALAAAEKLIRRCEEGSRKLALEAFRAAIAEVEKSGRNVVGCGLLLSSGRPLGDLPDTLASHAKIHTADGEHFRAAIARAAEQCGLSVARVRERDVWKTAAGKMKVRVETFQTRIAALGKTLGPPWRADEKLATAVGCLALAGASARR